MKALVCSILLISAVVLSAQAVRDQKLFDKNRPLERELQMNVSDGFTLGAVGDCILTRPITKYAEKENRFSEVIQLLKQADAMYGNLETTIMDIQKFQGAPYSWDGDWALLSNTEVAADLAEMGFDLFSRANNHVMDWGLEGMRETGQHLDEANLVYAGVGENEGQARSAHYFEYKKGRIGIISLASTFRPTTNALAPYGVAPGRPGLNGLALEKITIVPSNVMNSLVNIKKNLNLKDSSDRKQTERLELFGNNFETGKQFGYRYEMNQFDLSDILKNVRQGKQNCDFLVVAIHSHESSTEGFPEMPAGFLQELAKKVIDAGGDAFLTTGHHHLGPIEVYKGRPIFYGLGNFFWDDMQEPLPSDLYRRNWELLSQGFADPEKATDADLTAILNAQSFANDLTFQTIVAMNRFEKGKLFEIRLHPIDLGYGRRLTESGIPYLASKEKGLEILTRLQKISEPYGTRILIQDNLGIIRPF